jgi:hypothetical protein
MMFGGFTSPERRPNIAQRQATTGVQDASAIACCPLPARMGVTRTTIQGKDWGPKEIKTYWSVVREGDDWNIRMLTSVPAATLSPTTKSE